MRAFSSLAGVLSLLACDNVLAGILGKNERTPALSAPLHKTLASQNFPVGGDVWPVAIFWMEIQVGNPPRTFPVAIDSGSATLDIPSVNCPTCIKTPPNNAYDPSSSSTSSPLPCGILKGCYGQCVNNQCTFSNTYQTCDLSNPTAPCTITGSLFHDVVSIGSLGPVNVTFGAISSQTSNFDQFLNIDGVMGIAGSAGSTNVFSQIVAKGDAENVISMCFNEGQVSNGTITFGGIDPDLYFDQVVYTPNTGGGFSLSLTSLSINGSTVQGAATDSAILDSGTNVLLLPSTPFNSVKSILNGLCSSTKLHGVCDVQQGATLFDNKCFDFTPEEIALFPDLTFEFDGGLTLTMSGRDYLNLNDPVSPNQYCLGIRNTGSSFLILGDTLMQNYYTVFDIANNQIGFAKVNKENCGSQPLKNW